MSAAHTHTRERAIYICNKLSRDGFLLACTRIQIHAQSTTRRYASGQQKKKKKILKKTKNKPSVAVGEGDAKN